MYRSVWGSSGFVKYNKSVGRKVLTLRLSLCAIVTVSINYHNYIQYKKGIIGKEKNIN